MRGTDDPGRLHQWCIEDREYARQVAGRGRRHAYETFDPAATALVVIDMVPFFVDENPYCRGIVPNISRLADTLRGVGGHVAWVLPAVLTEPRASSVEFFGAAIADVFNRSGGTGPLRERLWPGFVVHDVDLVVEKTAASAFFPNRCELPDALADRRDRHGADRRNRHERLL